jgi:DNA repair exonuclease SbcCD ATPase subunit
MRLIRIIVDAFQCIAHAEVELAAGLNVLYGPNDLGKSSLAAAIRNVLLLPHASAAAKDLASWHAGDAPRVALTFSTDAHEIWRVTKRFGSDGSSLLEFSKDGASFATDASGRQVDGTLRELLQWGIGPPGGRGTGRGLPDSFLCNVLLAEQINVPDVLTRGLGGDGSQSARQRLNEALQALAQDPLFKRILDIAAEQVDNAFTATGQFKRGQRSPFRDVAQEIETLETQKKALQAKLTETISAQRMLEALSGELDEQMAKLADADGHLAAVREAQAQHAARAEVEEELRLARSASEVIQMELNELAQAEQAVSALGEQVELAERALAEKSAAAAASAQARDEAEQRLQRVSSEQGVAARRLALQELEHERLKATTRRDELQRSVAAAETARQRRQEESAARTRLDDVNARLAAAEKALAACAAADSAARAEVSRQSLLETVARLRDARARLEAAEQSAAQARIDRETASKRREESAGLEERIVALRAPADDVVRQLAELERQVQLAEAHLNVGLAVELRPLADVRVQVALDGGASEEVASREPLIRDAKRSVAIRVDELLDIAITAGEATARAEAERLRARWNGEALPVLAAAGVSSLGDLEERCRQAEALRKQLAERRGEIEVLDQRAAEAERRADGVEELRRRVGHLESELRGRDRAELEAELGDLGAGWETEIERRKAAADEASRKAAWALQTARDNLGALKAEKEGCGEAHRQAAAIAAEAMALFPDGVDALLGDARRELAEIEPLLTDLAARIEAMSHQAADDLAQARQERQAAGERFEAAEEAVRVARTARDELRQGLARASGSLEERRRQAERLDLPATEAKVEEITRRLAALPVPAIPAGEAEIEAAEQRVRQISAAIEETRSRIFHARGALEQVGGNVVREDLQDVERALQLALDRQGQIEVELKAWKLLQETLREAENSDGAHLGRALAGPLAEQFGAVTGGRYGPIAVGQDLDLPEECVEAAGELRSYTLLSAGTQDQLGTIFRLCIAEQLGTFIVLDDHLSQCDPAKIDWFRDRLLRAAERIQIVLLTCRPEDYLDANEFPTGDDVVRDSGLLRAVNLGRAIQRYPLATAHRSVSDPASVSSPPQEVRR